MNFFFNGDFRVFYPENIKDFATFPSAWDSSLNTGLGISQLSSLWITSYFNFTALFTKLGLSWNVIQFAFWILPALVISFLSSFFLFRYLFKNIKYAFISGLIYVLNTYFLMILTGGQLGVSLSYSLVPLILLFFIKTLDKLTSKNLILAGIVLGLQLIFDPRIVYITLLTVFIYTLFNISKLKSIPNKFVLGIPFLIAILLNSFWILPLVITKTSPLPSGFNSADEFKFFSFANFSNGLSLLHPNWPENIFGKVYFLDPKFLILPIIAFSSLLFVRTMKQSSNRTIVFFSILALLGIFLAKGANPPFGEVNIWLFSKFPGMSMFRDPTKWYTLVAISYSMLIPFALSKIATRISNFKLQHGLQISNSLLLFVFLFLLFLVSPIVRELKIQQVPQDYVSLANFLDSQKSFFRTLWIPKWQRFGFFSNNHPAIGREELYHGNAQKQISQLNQNLLVDLSIKYIIVPYDSGGEIFIKDRKYDDIQYKDTLSKIKKITWLKEANGFGKIHVFEITNAKDHFWSPSPLEINYKYLSPTEYKVQVRNARKGDLLVFSEGFDRNWVAQISNSKIQSTKFDKSINSFILPRDGSYEFKVWYEPQKYSYAGLFVSLASFIGLLVFLTVKFHL